MTRTLACLALALALAGCNKTPEKTTGGTADGEILPGSASDAMLPLDTVRSQPPLAPKVETSGKAESGAKAAGAGASDAAAAGEAEAAATPTKDASPAPEAPAT